MIALGLDIGGTSIKASLLKDGVPLSHAKSIRYDRPSRQQLDAALADVLGKLPSNQPSVVGVCAPGLIAPSGDRVERSLNVPGVAGVPLSDLIDAHMQSPVDTVRVVTDVHAAAHDIWRAERLSGRLLLVALGTGVGGIVLDDGEPLRVSGMSSGHLGQIDVSLEEPAPVGSDGGRGGLEAYVGLRALQARFGHALIGFAPTPTELSVRALVRGLRIAHAIYRPNHVRLAGGVGLLMAPAIDQIRAMVCDGLTSLARPEWTLASGQDLFHSARGAARLAMPESNVR